MVGPAGDAMIPYPLALKATGAAHSGVEPAHLLDVLDVNGNAYYWSDRPVSAPTVLSPYVIPGTPGFTLEPPVALTADQFVVWAYPTETQLSGLAEGFTRPDGGRGVVNQIFDGPFSSLNQLKFLNFQPSVLPPGAIVDSCYMVVMYDYADKAPFSTPSIPSGVKSGTLSVVHSLPGVGTTATFQYQNTTSSGEISAFWGLDSQSCTIHAIGICVIYHLPAAAKFGSSGSGLSPLIVAPGYGPYVPWILSVPKFVFNRSLATDFGSFVLQNLSGDTLARDFEKIARRSALEGAFFIYRLWQPDVRQTWLEVHGTLTVEGIPSDQISLKGVQLINPAAYDTPAKQYSETCQQVIWGGPGCGASGSTECKYSFQTCQVPEHFLGSLNSYEKNYGEALANVPLKVINRARRI
jgi:hypothetical protein